MLKKIITGILLVSVSFAGIGCTNTTDNGKTASPQKAETKKAEDPDQKFKGEFVKILESNWKIVNKNSEERKKRKTSTIAADYYEHNRSLKKVIEDIKKFKDYKFKNEEIRKLYLQYMDNLKELERLYRKAYESGNISEGDNDLSHRLSYNNNEIISQFHDRYGFKFDEKLYDKRMADFKKRKEMRDALSSKLTDKEKEEYKPLKNYRSLFDSEKDCIGKKVIIDGIIGKVDSINGIEHASIALESNYNNCMFVIYSENTLNLNLKPDQHVRCYAVYQGLGSSFNNQTGKTEKLPLFYSKLIEVR